MNQGETMKKFLSLLLLPTLIVALFLGDLHAQQGGKATPIRGVASLPATDNTFVQGQQSKGPVPWVDVTSYDRRGGSFGPNGGNGSVPTTRATCQKGRATIYLSDAVFNNGDGLSIRECGATNTMNTPSAPSLGYPTPGVSYLAEGGTSTYSSVITPAPSGSSIYTYAIVARDKFGALTAASPTASAPTFLSKIGAQTVSITSMSRSNETVTINVPAGSTNLSVGARIHICCATTSGGADFSGDFVVSTVNNATGVITVAETGIDTRMGRAASAAGGTLTYFAGNYIYWVPVIGAFEYVVCAKRPGDGSMHVIGMSGPTEPGGGTPGNIFVDWGATMTANQTFPPGVADSVCTSKTATNDPLTTTVVSGGGTTTITVVNAASQDASNKTAVYDDGPTFVAAANASSSNAPGFIGVPLYVPQTTVSSGQTRGYVINSYTKLPANISVLGVGTIFLNETLEISSATNWDGGYAARNAAGFAWGGWEQISCMMAYPCIYSQHLSNSNFKNLSINSGRSNGDLLWVVDDGYQDNWDHVSFDTGQQSNNDLMGQALMFRSTTSGGNVYTFTYTSFTGGPSSGANSWTPFLYFPQSRNSDGGWVIMNNFISMDHTFFKWRGVEHDSPAGGTAGRWDLNWVYRQGGNQPVFTIYGQGPASLDVTDAVLDTDTQPLIALLGFANSSGRPIANLNLSHVIVCSSEGSGGGVPPFITGYKPAVAIYTQSGCNVPDANYQADYATFAVVYPWETNASAPQGQWNPWFEGFSAKNLTTLINPPYWMGVAMPPSDRITATVLPGGSVPEGTYIYKVTSVDLNGSESAPKAAAKVTTRRGIQTVDVSWIPAIGAVSQNVFRCDSTGNNCFRIAFHVSGSTYRDASKSAMGASPPQSGAAVMSYFGADGIYTPRFRNIVNEMVYSTVPILDLSRGNVQQFSCRSPRATISPTISGLASGVEFVFVFVQNGTSACTLNFPSSIHGATTASSTLNSISVWKFIASANGTDAYQESATVGMTGGKP
jgi:hypothetical protein